MNLTKIEFEGHHIHEMGLDKKCIKCNKTADELTVISSHGDKEFGQT